MRAAGGRRGGAEQRTVACEAGAGGGGRCCMAGSGPIFLQHSCPTPLCMQSAAHEFMTSVWFRTVPEAWPARLKYLQAWQGRLWDSRRQLKRGRRRLPQACTASHPRLWPCPRACTLQSPQESVLPLSRVEVDGHGRGLAAHSRHFVLQPTILAGLVLQQSVGDRAVDFAREACRGQGAVKGRHGRVLANCQGATVGAAHAAPCRAGRAAACRLRQGRRSPALRSMPP